MNNPIPALCVAVLYCRCYCRCHLAVGSAVAGEAVQQDLWAYNHFLIQFSQLRLLAYLKLPQFSYQLQNKFRRSLKTRWENA